MFLFVQVTVVMFGSRQTPRIRFLLAAMANHRHARCAYIHSQGIAEMEKLRHMLKIDKSSMETLLVFNDLPEVLASFCVMSISKTSLFQRGPVARLSSHTQITADAMHRLIEQHKFLILPRVCKRLF